MNCLKPSPSLPSMLSAGMRTFSKKSGEVIEERRPILSSSLAEADAGRARRDDEAADAAAAGGVVLVRAVMTITPAMRPLVI